VSPVSRGRNQKNQRGGGRRSGNPAVRAQHSPARQATAEPRASAGAGDPGAGGRPDTRLFAPDPASRAWWPASFATVLDAAAPLSGCAGPEELEQATAELIAGLYHGWLGTHTGGHELLGWMDGLIAAAGKRTADSGVRYLLHGLAAICPARHQPALRAALRAAAGRYGGDGRASEWPARTAHLDAVAPARLLVDAYRSRYGLVVRVERPGSAARTHLIDVDLCLPVAVPLSGMYGDEDAAISAWRAQVGPSADGVVPGPVSPAVLAELLPNPAPPLGTEPLVGDETPRQLAGYFRMRRIAESLTAAMQRSGAPLPARSRRRQDGLTSVPAGRVEDFLGWGAAQGLPAFGREPVEWVMEEWAARWPDPAETGVSPHRVVGFLQFFLGFYADGPERDAALAVVPHWIRYCVERLILPAALADPVLDLAARAAADPAAVARLGKDLPPPISELTVLGALTVPANLGSSARG
jgi:hypothetical protein